MAKKIVYGLILTFVISSSLIFVSTQATSNALLNGDFETGTLTDWQTGGICSVSSLKAHIGTYSAYISDAVFDSWISQVVYPRERLSVDAGVNLAAWVYPSKTGLMAGSYPDCGIELTFYTESSMQLALYVTYSWSCSVHAYNGTNLFFYLPSWSTSQWNFLARDVAADMHTYYQNLNFSDIVLYSVTARYHYSDDSPGPFYVDDMEVSAGAFPFIELQEVKLFPICPPPYIPSNQTRTNEPVRVEVNATGPVEEVLLKFRRTGEQWYNTSMNFNDTEGVWAQMIPGQAENCTMELLVEVWDTYGLHITSTTYSFSIKALIPGDINGDGRVDIKDVYKVCQNYGKTAP